MCGLFNYYLLLFIIIIIYHYYYYYVWPVLLSFPLFITLITLILVINFTIHSSSYSSKIIKNATCVYDVKKLILYTKCFTQNSVIKRFVQVAFEYCFGPDTGPRSGISPGTGTGAAFIDFHTARSPSTPSHADRAVAGTSR